jgi:hypothetical protein
MSPVSVSHGLKLLRQGMQPVGLLAGSTGHVLVVLRVSHYSQAS